MKGQTRNQIFVKSGGETVHRFSAYLQHNLQHKQNGKASPTSRHLQDSPTKVGVRKPKASKGRSEFNTLATGPRDAGSIHGSKTSMKPCKSLPKVTHVHIDRHIMTYPFHPFLSEGFETVTHSNNCFHSFHGNRDFKLLQKHRETRANNSLDRALSINSWLMDSKSPVSGSMACISQPNGQLWLNLLKY